MMCKLLAWEQPGGGYVIMADKRADDPESPISVWTGIYGWSDNFGSAHRYATQSKAQKAIDRQHNERGQRGGFWGRAKILTWDELTTTAVNRGLIEP
jgi:hypothetical protein